MNWIIMTVSFLGFWAIRFIYYWNKLRQIQRYKQYYIDYLKEINPDQFLQTKSLITQLFKEANLDRIIVPSVEPAGLGYVATMNIDVFANINNTDPRIVASARIAFENAIGVFRNKMKQSHNPLYWIEFIVKLPEKILSYIHIKPSDSITNIIQIAYWISMILIGLHAIHIIDIASWI